MSSVNAALDSFSVYSNYRNTTTYRREHCRWGCEHPEYEIAGFTINRSAFMQFVCLFEALRPGQHSFSNFGRLPGFNQYSMGFKCLAREHNTAPPGEDRTRDHAITLSQLKCTYVSPVGRETYLRGF